MYRILFFILFSINIISAQTYCAGDQISLVHQNQTHTVGAGTEEYNAGDDFRLADWNGDLNGGNYHVIFIDMSASWWGPCQSNAPIVDGLEEDWSEYGVKFVTSLTDAGTPYSSSQWQSNFGNSDTPLVVDENQSSTGFFSLFHDSWNAFPTFVLIDHTMTVRAKPWTLSSNSNTSSCDGSNTTINGWSGGNTNNFIQQLVNECGSLCEGVTQGDLNNDGIFNVQDIIMMVNMILSITEPDYATADMNQDGILNVQDVILLLNIILDR